MAKKEDTGALTDGSPAAIAALIPSPCLTRGNESWSDVHTAAGDDVFFFFQLCASPGLFVADLDSITTGGTFQLVPQQDIQGPIKVLLPRLPAGSYVIVWSFIIPPGVAWQSVAEVSVRGAGSGTDVVRFRLAKSSDGSRPVNHGFARIEVR